MIALMPFTTVNAQERHECHSQRRCPSLVKWATSCSQNWFAPKLSSAHGLAVKQVSGRCGVEHEKRIIEKRVAQEQWALAEKDLML